MPNIIPGSNVTPAPTSAPAADPNAGRMSVGGKLLSSYAVNAPTSGSQVPTAAPSVYSSDKAATHINTQVVPAMNKGLGDIALQNARVAGDPYAYLPGDTTDSYNKRVADYHAKTNPDTRSAAPASDPTKDAATDIANTPDAGHQFQYNTQTGDKQLIPLGTAPTPGFSLTRPSNPVINKTPVADSVSTQNGTTYNQYQDGTYGQVDQNGNFVGTITPGDFSNAKSNDPATIAKSIGQAILSVANGSYPLTAPQQAQVNGLNSQFQALIATQTQANANFTGATTVAMNLYGMGNSVAGLGEIKGTVDAGIQKIADLQSKQAAAVADMEVKFNQEDMTGLKAAYDVYNNSAKDIQANIDNLKNYAERIREHNETEADNLRTFNNTVAQQKVTNAEWSLTNAREDKLAASTIEKNHVEESKILADLKQLHQSDILTSGLPGGSVMGANGAPDPKLQAQYLQNVAKQNPGLALQIKAASEYRLPLTARFFATKAGQAFTQQMLQYDQNWDATNYLARQAYQTDLTKGKTADALNAANKAIVHLTSFADSVASLHNTGIADFVNAPLSAIANINNPAHQEKISQATTDADGVKHELAKFFRGSGATDIQSVEDWSKLINPNATPASLKGTVQGAVSLLAGQIGVLNQKYLDTMGHPPPAPLLQPETAAKLSSLKNQGYKVDIPGIGYTDPKAYIANDPNASTNMDRARTILTQQGLPVTPDNILQAAQNLPQ